MQDTVTTTKNKKYKLIKSLKQKKERIKNGLFTVEGIKSVKDALNSEYEVKYIVASESFDLSEMSGIAETIVIKDELFEGLCDTSTPQGVMAVLKMKEQPSAVKLNSEKLYIYCDNVSDPGNLGTIIRTADAAGLGGVLLSEGCADLYSPKTVRASMGSFFNIDVVYPMQYSELFKLKNDGFKLYCGALEDDSIDYTLADFKSPAVIVVGNEANGVCRDILEECEHIIIPIYGSAESLNVGVAAALLMYEAVRQRKGESDGK